jgi:hypothetical protein
MFCNTPFHSNVSQEVSSWGVQAALAQALWHERGRRAELCLAWSLVTRMRPNCGAAYPQRLEVVSHN